jgi:GTP-binding protein YchF
MEAGIVGLPNVGKSTLFNALTAAGIDSANYPFCTIDPNVGVVEVPDERLGRINRCIETQQVIPAALRLVDIAGLVSGASQGEGLGNQFLANIRNVDAILHVVRCFEDENVAHVDGGVDPIRDIETIDTELMLADMQSVEAALPKAQKQARSGDKEAKARVALLEKCQARLNDDLPIRGIELDEDDQRQIKSFGFLTAKPVLYVANVAEDDLHGEGELVQRVRDRATQEGGAVVPVCGKLEAELMELEGEERTEMLESVGLEEPALNALARAAYELLGLESFFTAGPKEIRAWATPIGSSAPEAAGVIHSDFQRGFIRAEVYRLEDLEHYGSEKAIREAGRLRTEGKNYVVQDGDICHFLFNV